MDIRVADKSKVLIPTWHNNLKETPTKQIRIIFSSFPPAADIPVYKKEYRKNGVTIHEYNDVGLLINHVEKIENLTFQGEKIETPRDLILSEWSGFLPLIEEIRYYALSESEELTLKPGENVASE